MYGYYNKWFTLVLETAQQASIEIPAGLCSRFIGKGGKHISELQERSGCTIDV